MALLPSVNAQIIKQAIAAQAAAASASQNAVSDLWQDEGETPAAFSRRVARARANLPDARLLLAVGGPNAIQSMPGVRPVEMPPAMLPLLTRAARYRICYGGRGAGRSWTFARALIVKCLERPTRVLCAREFMNSLSDSVHKLLSDQISILGLDRFFEVQATGIYSRNGSEIIFAGLRTNISKLKSAEGIQICWVEEAERVSAVSWETLIPTIRAPGSELWLSLNPDLATDPTYTRFIEKPPENAVVVKTTFEDNPWFPEVLRAEMAYLARVDDDSFRHVWLGECRQHSNAQILRGKYTVEPFDIDSAWSGPYLGLDFGFSSDPTAAVKCYIDGTTLYVSHEAYGHGIDIDRTPALLDEIPDARRYAMRADSSRPETISYLKRHGYSQIEGVEKWSGSVEDGIAHLRSYVQIKIHPRCEHTIQEARLYAYKTDRLTGDVLPDVVDKNNHCMDSLRYALAPLIKASGAEEFLKYLRGENEKNEAATANVPLIQRQGVIVTDLVSPWQSETALWTLKQ